jgi:hypothetical protein
MLLAHIDDLLASGREFDYSFQLYEEMVEAWLTREEGRVEGLQKEPLREFCERLAIELFARRQAEGSERLPHDAIEPLAQKFGIKLEGWKLSGRSLLNRDAEDNFKFAHRSIMEYLFVKRFLDLPIAERPQLSWTDQMKSFLLEMIRWEWEREHKMAFDFRFADLSGLFSLQAKPFFQFRTGTTTLSEEADGTFIETTAVRLRLLRESFQGSTTTLSGEAVENMLRKYDFFDSTKNQTGKGIFHLYEKREQDRQSIVVDYATGLTWQQSGSPSYLTFENAQAFVTQLNAEKHAGFNDWRLPTLEEAMSLMEPKKHSNLYIDPLFDRQQTWIWTADKESAGRAWYVDFGSGLCYRTDVGDGNDVRAVRSGQ